MTSFASLEQQKQELLDELRSWPPQRLAFRPSPEAWSALEMLDHIIRSEREILLRVYSAQPPLRSLGVADRLRTRFLESVFRSERKVKVPSKAQVVMPGKDLALPALDTQWDEVRATLKPKVDTLLASSSGKAIFHHPVGGWMDMQAVLDFFSVHLVHHGYQLTRLQAASAHLQAPQA